MTRLRTAVIRAYSSRWTAMLVAFELIGAIWVGRHARTTSLWPLILWFGCAPLIRYLYLQKLHNAAPVAWRDLAGRAYGVTVWLVLAGVAIALPLAGLAWMVRHLSELLAFSGRLAGYAGVVTGIGLLATGLVTVTGAAFLWGGLLTIAYARAVVDPARRIRGVVIQGALCVWRRAPLVVGISSIQGLLIAGAVGAQLVKSSGRMFVPMVWPAVFFAPVALAFLLALTELKTRGPAPWTSRAPL